MSVEKTSSGELNASFDFSIFVIWNGFGINNVFLVDRIWVLCSCLCSSFADLHFFFTHFPSICVYFSAMLLSDTLSVRFSWWGDSSHQQQTTFERYQFSMVSHACMVKNSEFSSRDQSINQSIYLLIKYFINVAR